MNLSRLVCPLVLLAALTAPAVPVHAQRPSSTPPILRPPDVVFVPTPQDVVDAMLKAARIGPNDILYDLGSGDGRIPIAAAKQYGARAVGIEIDPQRIIEANANLKIAGVGNRVRFLNQDLFTADLREATVVTLYLLPAINLKLIPKLNAELKPGTRVISHVFNMGKAKPRETIVVHAREVYVWTTPIQ